MKTASLDLFSPPVTRLVTAAGSSSCEARVRYCCGAALVAFVSLVGTQAIAAEPQVIRLWDERAPGETSDVGPEREIVRNETPKATRITDIGAPTLTIYRPAPDKDCGTTVVVCPGGGYNYVVVDKEGTEVIQWLNSLGVTGALLKYRVPARKDRPRHATPLEDIQRAIGLLRHRAPELKLNPERIGVMGFSAGGHVAALGSTQFDKRAYSPRDAADQASSRPDFALLIYPAYLTVKEQGDALAPELNVTAKTPPTFLMQTQDDGVRVESAVYYYLALKKAGVPGALHVYPNGGHGYGMRLKDTPAATWPDRATEWLKAGGWLAE